MEGHLKLRFQSLSRKFSEAIENSKLKKLLKLWAEHFITKKIFFLWVLRFIHKNAANYFKDQRRPLNLKGLQAYF